MMDLKKTIRDLRAAADALEVVLGFNNTPAAAAKIRNGLAVNGSHENMIEQRSATGRIYTKRSAKGFAYNGTHWTQTPKGRAHMREIQRKRFAKGNSPFQKKTRRTGTHWTQKPENKHILAAMIKKATATRNASK